jgi:Brp/Blh family beta-carotene 15,15'-monooxygenase
MTKAIFIFIASLLILLPFVLNADEIPTSYQLILCIPFILFLGIPHGAIDNVLYIRDNKIKNLEFIGIYLAFIALNILLWLIFPIVAYVVFLLLSAYHFGQSQFSHYFNKQPLAHKALFFSWGVSILSALIYFNIEEIQQIMIQEKEFAAFESLHQKAYMQYVFLASSIATFILMVLIAIKKSFNVEALLMETLVLFLIVICFYLMPILIGFTLYFIILHSLKVLREEYEFLNSKKEVNSIVGFVLLLAPFTLLSIVGVGLIYSLIYLEIFYFSYGYCLLIIISSITLPHIFVMNRFYKLFKQST